MCGYQGYEFGAGSYPDSLCIDGRLFDADDCDGAGNLADDGKDIPCPMCRRDDSIAWWTEHNSAFAEDEEDEAAALTAASASAVSLVDDIRKNRGLIAGPGETVSG